ncbi:MAG: hypothetical protein ABL876_13570 [Chitinophagaceae bacterium]
MQSSQFICILFCIISSHAFSQEYNDTTYHVREFTCSCKYNLDPQEDNKIFDRSAKSAYYPGGEEEWKKFAKKNLDKGFKGKHTVEVRFQVDKNGDLSGFTLLSTAPAQKYEEVVRVLRSSGKWFPSIQNGFCVKSSLRLSFEL